MSSSRFSTHFSANRGTSKYNNRSNTKDYSLLLNKANSFFKTKLGDNSITSTYLLGKEVYNIRDIESNRVLGYLGNLVNLEKLNSLVFYIIKKALESRNSNFIIILNYIKEDKFYYLTYNNNRVIKEEFLSSTIDLQIEFYNFKAKFFNTIE